MVISLGISIILSTAILGILREQFPGDQAQFNYKHKVAVNLLEYNRRLAGDLGVLEKTAVKKALADFSYDIEIAGSREELTQVILQHPRKAQETILREWEISLQEQIISLINQDTAIMNTEEIIRFNLKASQESVQEEPYTVLNTVTKARIKELFASQYDGREISLDIEAAEGEARVAVTGDLEEYVRALTEETDALRVSMRELRVASGLAEMNGSGVRVRIYDQTGALDNPSIVHDTDIRDVVNELFASGAQGVSVGGYRYIVNSSIRCSGSLIKIDGRLIAVNPVEIMAVGDPQILSSGLDIIRNTMEINRGLIFRVDIIDSITLPAHHRSE